MSESLSPKRDAYLRDHRWAVLATGRSDGSPQQSMVGYVVDTDGRVVVSVKSHTAKWRNVLRQPKVSLVVPDGRTHLVIYGRAEAIHADPERAALTAGRLTDAPPPDPSSIVEMLDEQARTVLRITPERVLFHE